MPYIIICPTAIAYSVGQIINSVCLCHCLHVSVCVSVCLSVHTLTVTFLGQFLPKVSQMQQPPKVRTSSLEVNITPPSPYFAPKLPFRTKTSTEGPENPSQHKCANICLTCPRIAGIRASYRKLGSRNMMVTSHFRPEVEIRHFHACALKCAV